MRYDLLIRGGEVIDPASDRYGRYDIAVANGIIAAVEPDVDAAEAGDVVDAGGLYVTPGLVDLHTHCYWGTTYWGIEADPVAARSGVTTWFDAGSAGAYSLAGFRHYVAEASRARLFAFLNVSSIGLIGRTYELSNLEYCDVGLAADIVEANRDLVRGIKARIDRDTTRGTGLEPLGRARELADRVGLRLMVHIATAPPPLEEIAVLLRPGDILTHCYTNQDNTLLAENGQLHPAIRRLHDEGLILDVGHGTGSFSYPVVERLLADGILPDVISSDIHQLSILGPMYDLPTTLSKFLNLGLPLHEVIARATVRPAALMGRPDLGTLRVGSVADMALFRLEEGTHTFHDINMQERRGTVRLVNVATYVNGVRLPHAEEQPSAPWIANDFPAITAQFTALGRATAGSGQPGTSNA